MKQIEYSISDKYDEIVFLKMHGKITVDYLDDVHVLMEQIFDLGRGFLIVDLKEATGFCGPVLGELLEWRNKFVRKYDGDICFANASIVVEKIIREMDGDKLFNFFSDMNSAINYLFWEYKGQVDTVILTIPNSLSIVPATRKFVRQMVESKGYNHREIFQVETIVDELCNNAIEHGNQENGTIVELALAIGRTKIDINISNGIDNEAGEPDRVVKYMEHFVDSPNTSINETRGRGLALVKMLSNEFDIDSSEDGTCVHVTKFREGRKNADAN